MRMQYVQNNILCRPATHHPSEAIWNWSQIELDDSWLWTSEKYMYVVYTNEIWAKHGL